MYKSLKDVYDFSYCYLLDQASNHQASNHLTQKQIDDFISTPDFKTNNSISDAYELLLSILQDFNSFPKVINFADRKAEIEKILKKKYGKYDLKYISELKPEELLKQFKNEFHFKKDTMWLRYTKGVISGAKFMLGFKDYNDFKNTFDFFNNNDMTRQALALFLSNKIFNMGFATACNWLKELGYHKYAKPDTHTKDICATLHLDLGNEKNIDIACFEAIVEVAKVAGVEAYKVDKVWWLICSGDFYRYNIKLPVSSQKLKGDFLTALRNEFSL